jgi:UDP:flavonoid glycosyltransferase YjiC (YdhE family)
VLAHGLPSVLLPQSADNFVIAQRIADAGAAVSLMPADVSAGAVREAAEKVLADESFRHRAERLAGEIAAMPGPDEVAALLAERA